MLAGWIVCIFGRFITYEFRAERVNGFAVGWFYLWILVPERAGGGMQERKEFIHSGVAIQGVYARLVYYMLREAAPFMWDVCVYAHEAQSPSLVRSCIVNR